MSSDRDDILLADDASLLAQCRIESFRGRGRGGQKRNVTDSAVRMTHPALGVAATSDESRSQIHNRKAALALLRQEIALQCRSTGVPDTWRVVPAPGRKTPAYSLWMARLLDILAINDYAVGITARQVGTTTGRLIRMLAANPAIWQWLGQKREGRGMRHLKMPE